MLDTNASKFESGPHFVMLEERTTIAPAADLKEEPTTAITATTLPENKKSNRENQTSHNDQQHHREHDQLHNEKQHIDDTNNNNNDLLDANNNNEIISTKLDQAECLCKDDKLLSAAHLLQGIHECHFRPIHRYILHEAAIFNRLLKTSNAHDDDDVNDATNHDGEWINQGTHTGRHNFSLHYKLDNTSNSQSILTCRIETPIPSSLLVPLLSVLNESDLYSTWIPQFNVPKLQVVKSIKLRQSGRCSQIIHVETIVPWPLAQRDLYLKAVACDDIDDGGRIVVRIQSLDVKDNAYLKEEEDGFQIPPNNKRGAVRMEVEGGFVFEKCPVDHPMAGLAVSNNCSSSSGTNAQSTTTTTTRTTRNAAATNPNEDLILVTFSFSVDPKLPIIPKSFINFFLRTAMGQMWNMFLNVAEDIKEGKRPAHSDAIGEKRELLYDWVEERTKVMMLGRGE